VLAVAEADVEVGQVQAAVVLLDALGLGEEGLDLLDLAQQQLLLDVHREAALLPGLLLLDAELVLEALDRGLCRRGESQQQHCRE
jgi:hypothetical protein